MCVYGLMHLNTLLHKSPLHSSHTSLCMFPCFSRATLDTLKRSKEHEKANQRLHILEFRQKKGVGSGGKVHLFCSHWDQSCQALRAVLPWLQQSHLPHQAPAHHSNEHIDTMGIAVTCASKIKHEADEARPVLGPHSLSYAVHMLHEHA